MSDLKSLGEFGLIDRIAAHGLARENGVIKGIGDDCAVLELDSDSVLLVTTDTLVEDIDMVKSLQNACDSRNFVPGRMSKVEAAVHNTLNWYLDRMFG